MIAQTQTRGELSSAVEPDIAAVAEEWEDLADRTQATPFVEPGWIAAWWRAFGSGRLEVHVVRRDDRLVGVLPVGLRAGRAASPTNFHTPAFGLVAEDGGAADRLAAAVLDRRPRRLSVGFLDADGPDLAALLRGAAAARYRPILRTQLRSPFIRLAPSLDAYRAQRRSSAMADLRRKRRRLSERGHAALERVTGGPDLANALDEGFRLERLGWKGSRGTAVASVPALREFYGEVARWAAARGWLRLFLLRIDGRALAFYYGLEHRHVLHLLKGGYDPAWARLSPGQLLLEDVIASGFSHGIERIELGGSDERYKRVFANSVRERQRLQVFSPTPAGRCEWAVMSHGRRLAARLSLDRALRRIKR
jgi:CelD/BcsL family acetyltransferase involved in cellulose biosynthesis